MKNKETGVDLTTTQNMKDGQSGFTENPEDRMTDQFGSFSNAGDSQIGNPEKRQPQSGQDGQKAREDYYGHGTQSNRSTQAPDAENRSRDAGIKEDRGHQSYDEKRGGTYEQDRLQSIGAFIQQTERQLKESFDKRITSDKKEQIEKCLTELKQVFEQKDYRVIEAKTRNLNDAIAKATIGLYPQGQGSDASKHGMFKQWAWKNENQKPENSQTNSSQDEEDDIAEKSEYEGAK